MSFKLNLLEQSIVFVAFIQWNVGEVHIFNYNYQLFNSVAQK